MMSIAKYCTSLAAAALLLAPLSLTAQTPTQALINVDSTSSAAVAQSDISLKLAGKAVPLTGWNPLMSTDGDGIQIAILIDDSLKVSMSTQDADIQSFINHLPKNVQVYVGFIQTGHVTTVHDFSNNHAEVASAVKPPPGTRGIVPNNPYSAIADMIKHWPVGPSARIVLVLSSGIDPANSGGGDPTEDGGSPDSTNIRPAQDAAWKSGVAIYSIFYNESAAVTADNLVAGQAGLASLMESTGGASYAEGTRSPVFVGPILERFQKALGSTYVAIFAAPSGKKTLGLKATTTAKDTKLHAPENILPGNLEAPAGK